MLSLKRKGIITVLARRYKVLIQIPPEINNYRLITIIYKEESVLGIIDLSVSEYIFKAVMIIYKFKAIINEISNKMAIIRIWCVLGIYWAVKVWLMALLVIYIRLLIYSSLSFELEEGAPVPNGGCSVKLLLLIPNAVFYNK